MSVEAIEPVDDREPTPFVTVTPQDLWPDYEPGGGQFPPVDPEEQIRFDQARLYEVWHRAVPEPLKKAFSMPADVLEWAREGEDTPGRDLLLWGYVGTGKSWSSVAGGALRAGLRRQTFKFVLANKALRALKNWSDTEAMELMRADLTLPNVLVLDDIGREKFNDPDVANLTELMDDRHGAGKVTIFTTNRPPFRFEEYFGSHLTSRLLGGSLGLEIIGRDRRQNP